MAHPYCSPDIDKYLASVLSGTNSMGKWWAIILFRVLMVYELMDSITGNIYFWYDVSHSKTGLGPKVATFTARWLP